MTQLLLAVLVLAQFTFGQQPCVLTARNGVTWTTSTPAQALACFNAVPFNPTYKSQTLAMVKKLVDLYAFADISKNSGDPFNIKVDLRAGVSAIETGTQASDWELHYKLSRLFFSLGDAHTLYVPPTPYTTVHIIKPFFLSSAVVGGKQVVSVSNTVSLSATDTYNSLTGLAVDQYIGKNIVSINGVPIINYLQKIGRESGTTRDGGVAFNIGLKRFIELPSHQVDWTEVSNGDTYVFEGIAQSVKLPPLIFWFQVYTGLNDFTAKIPYSVNRKREDDEKPHILKYYYEAPDGTSVPTDIIQEHQRITDLIVKPEHEERVDLVQEIHAAKERQATIIAATTNSEAFCFTQTANGKAYDTVALTTFSPKDRTVLNSAASFNAWYASYVGVIEACIDHSQSNNQKNLVVDVRSNGGGIICLAQSAQLALFDEWDPAKTNHLLEPYDYRTSATSRLLLGFEEGSGYRDPTKVPAANFTNFDWYSNTQTYTRGGVQGSYSPKWYFPNCNDILGLGIKSQGYKFEKVIVLTDGLCGSACSLFATKIRYHGMGALVSVGGVKNQPLETSSFTGGNVEDWPSFIGRQNPSINGFTQLPTSAFMRFNWREMYLGNEPLPREFQRYEADARIENWRLDLTPADYTSQGAIAAGYFDSGINWPVKSLGAYYLETDSSAAVMGNMMMVIILVIALVL